MESENKIKMLDRYDNYYNWINNKGSFILALNTMIISGFFIGFNNMLPLITQCEMSLFKILIGLIILLSLVAIFIVILAIIPFLNSDKKSFWFFNDVANRELGSFVKEIDNQTNEEIITDLNSQLYYLAKGLKRKHCKIKIALILNIIQLFIIGIIAFLIVF